MPQYICHCERPLPAGPYMGKPWICPEGHHLTVESAGIDPTATAMTGAAGVPIGTHFTWPVSKTTPGQPVRAERTRA